MGAGEGKKAKEIHPPSCYKGREGEKKRWGESEGTEYKEEGWVSGVVIESLFWLF